MAGEIQLNSTTMATESSGSITAQLDTIRPNTTNGSLTLQGDSSDAGVTGLTIDSSGNATFAQTISGGTLGSSVVFPTDHIIQIVTLSTTAQSSIGNGNEFTSIRKSITPLATGSRLMINYSFGHIGSSGTIDLGLAPIRSTDSGSTWTEFYVGSSGTRNVLLSLTSVPSSQGHNMSHQFIDPDTSTTAGSAVMYSIRAYCNSGSVYFNRRGLDTTNAARSTITIFELAG